MMEDHALRLVEALAEPGQPALLLGALDAVLAKVVGHRLITLLQVTPDGKLLRRLYSNNAKAYPAGGFKPVADTPWTEMVIRRRQPFLGPRLIDIERNLADHKLIASLGLGSIINLPIVYDGKTLGALNILEAEGFYGPQHLAAARPYAAFALPALLDTG